MDSGYIKIHRRLLDWEWFDSDKHLRVFLTILMRANYKPSKWRGVDIAPGQLLTGRKQLAQWTGLSERKIRTVLEGLKSTKELTIRSTAKFSIITITNWEDYQCHRPAERPASDQQATTSKKEKKDKNNIYSLAKQVIDLLNDKIGTAYKPNAKRTVDLIRARVNEGYTNLVDYEHVIVHKKKKWGSNAEMHMYLRPQTLFGNKFESYLQEAQMEEKTTQAFIDALGGIDG